MSFWKIVTSPQDGMFSQGNFLIYLHMELYYPQSPPKVRFVTPIYDPNINRNGRVCHGIFNRDWTADTTNIDVLSIVCGLLFHPEYKDPV